MPFFGFWGFSKLLVSCAKKSTFSGRRNRPILFILSEKEGKKRVWNFHKKRAVKAPENSKISLDRKKF